MTNIGPVSAQRTNYAWTRGSLTFIGIRLTILNENFNASTAMYAMFFLAVGLAFSLIAVGRFLMTFGGREIGKFLVRNQLVLATSIIVFTGHILVLLFMVTTNF